MKKLRFFGVFSKKKAFFSSFFFIFLYTIRQISAYNKIFIKKKDEKKAGGGSAQNRGIWAGVEYKKYDLRVFFFSKKKFGSSST
jgi:hypothetical protein